MSKRNPDGSYTMEREEWCADEFYSPRHPSRSIECRRCMELVEELAQQAEELNNVIRERTEARRERDEAREELAEMRRSYNAATSRR